MAHDTLLMNTKFVADIIEHASCEEAVRVIASAMTNRDNIIANLKANGGVLSFPLAQTEMHK